jgi:hypothetical protein
MCESANFLTVRGAIECILSFFPKYTGRSREHISKPSPHSSRTQGQCVTEDDEPSFKVPSRLVARLLNVGTYCHIKFTNMSPTLHKHSSRLHSTDRRQLENNMRLLLSLSVTLSSHRVKECTARSNREYWLLDVRKHWRVCLLPARLTANRESSREE